MNDAADPRVPREGPAAGASADDHAAVATAKVNGGSVKGARGGPGFWLAAAAVLAGLVWLADLNRHVNDDAFIIFRYARNLAEGEGLVWNPGQRVEGYTSPLWTLMLAGGIAAGLDPVRTAQNLGLAFFAIAAGAVLFTTRRLSRSSLIGVLLTLVYGVNYSVSCYASGGLATSMHLCFAALIHAVMASMLADRRAPGGDGEFESAPAHDPAQAPPATRFPLGRGLLLSLLCGLAFVTRMEAALWIAPAMLVALVLQWRSAGGGSTLAWLGLVGPAVLLAATLFAHRLAYYGEWLPNTFHAKSGAGVDHELGLAYMRAFLGNYRLDLLLGLALPLVGWQLFRKGAAGGRVLTGVWVFVLAGWSAYLISVNGDYMEFRFMLPTVAPMLGLVAVGLRDLPRVRIAAAVLLCVLVGQAGWIQFKMQQEVAATLDPKKEEGGMKPADFGYELPEGVVPISNLRKNLHGRKPNWVGVGQALAEAFEHDPSVRIGVSAAGAIPYYSRLPTLDLMGLNDAWVARHGVVQGQRAGHTRYATPEHVMLHADLSLGHPLVVNRRQLSGTMARLTPQRFWVPRALLEDGARYLVLAVDRRVVVVMLQLRAHPSIDAAVAAGRFEAVPLPPRSG